MQKRARKSRPYDARRTKRAILDAAEEAFAEAGFSGARIDAIAKAAGCNKSLIYQYVGDKLALYTAVVKRVDEAGNAALEAALSDALRDDEVSSNPERFRAFLTAVVEATFKFLFQNERYVQILFWEAAEDWETWNRLSYRPDDASELVRVVERARQAGVVRSDFDPALFPVIIMTSTAGVLRFVRRFGGPDSDGAGTGIGTDAGVRGVGDEETAGASGRHRRLVDEVVRFVVHGMLRSP